MGDESPDMGERVEEMTQPRPWTYGLFNCLSDCRRCLCGYLCPCWLFHVNAARVGTKCGGVWWMVPGVNLFCCMQVRGKVRERRNIIGGKGGDCLVHGFCHPCAVTQEARELDESLRANLDEMMPPYVDEQPKKAIDTEEDGNTSSMARS